MTQQSKTTHIATLQAGDKPKHTTLEQKQEKLKLLQMKMEELQAEIEEDIKEQQLDAIEHLEEYMEAVDNRWANLRTFWKALQEERRGGGGA